MKKVTAPEPILDGLLTYLATSPSPFHAAENAARALAVAGFVGRDEAGAWEPWAGGSYVVRGGACVAWRMPATVTAATPVRIVGAHTDSPNLRIKPNPDVSSVGWRQLGVEVYGGALVNSWLDRDLGISGRVVRRDLTTQLVLADRPLARVPQLAIHLDHEVNEKGLVLDKQQHLTPLWGLGPPELAQGASFAEWLAAETKTSPGDILSWDLMFHDLTAPTVLGVNSEFIASARLDNLFSAYCALRSLSESNPTDAIQIVALFDHEEVGSGSTTGAAGPLLESVLHRVFTAHGIDRHRSLAASTCLSADMAHAVHPNYVDRHEPVPNGGPVLKINTNQRYATDATTAAAFRLACERADVPLQTFVSRNNMPCGSTIGPITATRLGIATVDVGCAQLSMHSARELAGSLDPELFVRALTAFFRGSES
jgi:aspartyl aminopeptidase